jgi:hypothetical protein
MPKVKNVEGQNVKRQNAESDKTSNEKNAEWNKMSNGKNVDWDKRLNSKKR